MDLREAMKNQNDVALILSRCIFSSQAKHSNIVFSPASINSALTLIASGPGDSTVANEILSFLKSSSADELKAVYNEIVSIVYSKGSTDSGLEISSVNGVWMEQSLSIDPKFKDLFENFFKAAFERADFRSKAEEVRMEVNSWVQDQTNDLIKNLLPPDSVTNETDRIYANALYFKGTWKDPFDEDYTYDTNFYLLDGSSISVPFMRSNEDQYVSAYDGFKVLRLPYLQDRDDTSRIFAMYFYLPDKKDGLHDLLEKMADVPGFIYTHIPSEKVELEAFRIPKFKIEFGFLVSEVLNHLGLHSVSPFYHKACIKIDESGVEAAAASAESPDGCYFDINPPKRIDFVADHPFLFLIREDKTGTVLFVGQVLDPSESS